MIDTIIKIMLNTIFVSIPEEIFAVVMILYISNKSLINNFDLSRFKVNKKVILIPAILSALISNIFRYTGLQETSLAFLPPIIMLIGVLIVNNIYNYENKNRFEIIKLTSIGFLISIFIMAITESIFALLIMLVTSSSLSSINDNVFLNIICSLPGRITQYLLLFILLIKYNKHINLIYETCKTVKGKIFSIIYIILNIMIMCLLTIGVNIFNMEIDKSILILSIGFCYPLSIFFVTILIIYFILYNRKY